MNPDDLRELFEKWFRAQFVTDKKAHNKLLEFNESGYADEMINAMWIGFVAHDAMNKGN